MQNEHKMPKLYIYYAYIVYMRYLLAYVKSNFTCDIISETLHIYIYRNSAYRNLIIVIICVRNHYKCISLSRLF